MTDQEREDNPGNVVTLEEMGREAAPAAPKPKAAELKIESDDVPEAYRGKTVAEIVAAAETARNALSVSESARLALAQASEQRSAPAPAPAPVPEVKQPTREELRAMYDEDPLAAIDKMQEIAIANAAKHFEARLGTLTAGTSDANERWAREEFKDEFAVLGKEIEAFRRTIPDQSIFSTKKGWQDLVAYVRGQSGNFEKVMEAKTSGRRPTAETARAEAAAEAGFSPGTSMRSSLPTNGTRAKDPTAKKIMQEFIDSGVFKDEAEYDKWARLGGQ